MKHYVAEINVAVTFESDGYDPSEDFIEKYQALQEFVESNYGSISISENEGDYEGNKRCAISRAMSQEPPKVQQGTTLELLMVP